MPRGLHRSYGAYHLHFITYSCYHRLPLLRSARSRDCLLSVLEQTRTRYRFVVVGYVVMPEHLHLLLSEPEIQGHGTFPDFQSLGDRGEGELVWIGHGLLVSACFA